MRWGATSYAVWVLVAGAAGCHHHRPASAPPPRAVAELPPAPRQVAEVEVAAAAAAPAARPTTVRRLTAAECRALAAQNAPLADDLDRRTDGPSHPRLRPRKADRAECGRLVRGYAADELRNRAAAAALDDFYKLARAEAQYDLLLTARAEVAARLAEADAAARHGFRDRGDAPRAQLHDLDAQLAQLGGGIGALNAGLRGRLGLDPADPTPLGPADPLRIPADDSDVDAAVRTALRYRPDLNLIRALLGCRDDAGLAGQVLAGINPLLAAGSGHPVAALLTALCGADDGSGGRLESALAGRERQAEAEVRAAAATLGGHRAAAAARAAAVKDAAARVEDFEKRAATGLSVTAELSAARLELQKARGALLESAAEWHRTDVRLRQATGALVRE